MNICDGCGKEISIGAKCCRACYLKMPTNYAKSNEIFTEVELLIQPYLKHTIVSSLTITKELSAIMETSSHKPTIGRFVRMTLKQRGYVKHEKNNAKHSHVMVFDEDLVNKCETE